MFERFTERARQVVVLAQEEARTLKHNYIGNEHIVLGIAREEEGFGARVLSKFNFDADAWRGRLPAGQEPRPNGQIPFTDASKRTLELALREALSLGHNYIGTEHLLLSLVRQGTPTTHDLAEALGVADGGAIRDAVLRELVGTARGRQAAGLLMPTRRYIVVPHETSPGPVEAKAVNSHSFEDAARAALAVPPSAQPQRFYVLDAETGVVETWAAVLTMQKEPPHNV